jgi:hypothetical protein
MTDFLNILVAIGIVAMPLTAWWLGWRRLKRQREENQARLSGQRLVQALILAQARKEEKARFASRNCLP